MSLRCPPHSSHYKTKTLIIHIITSVAPSNHLTLRSLSWCEIQAASSTYADPIEDSVTGLRRASSILTPTPPPGRYINLIVDIAGRGTGREVIDGYR